jgi:hypothetical protein
MEKEMTTDDDANPSHGRTRHLRDSKIRKLARLVLVLLESTRFLSNFIFNRLPNSESFE